MAMVDMDIKKGTAKRRCAILTLLKDFILMVVAVFFVLMLVWAIIC
mgnify:CR=1 FL=1